MRISELMLLHWFDRKTGRSFSVLVIGFSHIYSNIRVPKRPNASDTGDQPPEAGP